VVQQGEPVFISAHKAPEHDLSYNEAGPLIVLPVDFIPLPLISEVHSTSLN